MWNKLHSGISQIPPRLVAWTLIALVTLILWVRYPFRQVQAGSILPGDFQVYLQAWDRVVAGLTPYVLTDPSPYKYSPGVLTLMGLLPASPHWAWFIFATLSILCLGLSLALGARTSTWKSVGMLLVGFLLSWKGILETLDYGQVELLILGLAVLSAATLQKSPFISGLLAGMLPWIKLPWGLLIIPLYLAQGLVAPHHRRRARLISGYLTASFLWGAMIPSLVFGPDRAKEISQAWFELLRVQPSSLFHSNLNQSLWISVARWLGGTEGVAVWLAAILVALALLVSLGLGLRKRQEAIRDISASAGVLSWFTPWLVLTQLFNPLAWRWGSVFVVGIPFAAVAMAKTNHSVWRSRLRWVRPVLWGLVALLWLAQQNPALKLIGLEHWSVLHGYGLVTSYWIALLLLCI